MVTASAASARAGVSPPFRHSCDTSLINTQARPWTSPLGACSPGFPCAPVRDSLCFVAMSRDDHLRELPAELASLASSEDSPHARLPALAHLLRSRNVRPDRRGTGSLQTSDVGSATGLAVKSCPLAPPGRPRLSRSPSASLEPATPTPQLAPVARPAADSDASGTPWLRVGLLREHRGACVHLAGAGGSLKRMLQRLTSTLSRFDQREELWSLLFSAYSFQELTERVITVSDFARG